MLPLQRITHTVSSRIVGFYIELQGSLQQKESKSLSSIELWARPDAQQATLTCASGRAVLHASPGHMLVACV